MGWQVLPATHNAGGILAMKKRSYRAQKVNEVRWEEVADRVKDKAVVWAVDVAKVAGKGALGTPQSPPGPCSRYEMTQDDQTPNHSPLAQSVTRDGKTVGIDIYEDGEGGWPGK